MVKLVTIFDTETSGLPVRPSTYRRYADPFTETDLYNNARLVEIAYITYVLNEESGERLLLDQRSMLVKPCGFHITNSFIHGITHDMANTHGYSIHNVLEHFMDVVNRTDILVCHNVDFDKNIMSAELVKNKNIESATHLYSKTFVCTMKTATDKYKMKRFPTLQNLYKSIVPPQSQSWEQQHRAMDDAQRTAECYFVLSS